MRSDGHTDSATSAALRKEDIDLGRLHRLGDPADLLPAGRGHTFGPPKSKAGIRLMVFADIIVPDLRALLEDLRHVGNQFTSDAGASLREMMTRMGYSTTRAALVYQHSTTER